MKTQNIKFKEQFQGSRNFPHEQTQTDRHRREDASVNFSSCFVKQPRKTRAICSLIRICYNLSNGKL